MISLLACAGVSWQRRSEPRRRPADCAFLRGKKKSISQSVWHHAVLCKDKQTNQVGIYCAVYLRQGVDRYRPGEATASASSMRGSEAQPCRAPANRMSSTLAWRFPPMTADAKMGKRDRFSDSAPDDEVPKRQRFQAMNNRPLPWEPCSFMYALLRRSCDCRRSS